MWLECDLPSSEHVACGWSAVRLRNKQRRSKARRLPSAHLGFTDDLILAEDVSGLVWPADGLIKTATKGYSLRFAHQLPRRTGTSRCRAWLRSSSIPTWAKGGCPDEYSRLNLGSAVSMLPARLTNDGVQPGVHETVLHQHCIGLGRISIIGPNSTLLW